MCPGDDISPHHMALILPQNTKWRKGVGTGYPIPQGVVAHHRHDHHKGPDDGAAFC